MIQNICMIFQTIFLLIGTIIGCDAWIKYRKKFKKIDSKINTVENKIDSVGTLVDSCAIDIKTQKEMKKFEKGVY